MKAAAVSKPSIGVREVAIDAMMIALTLAATMFVNLRLPIASNGGLIHLGNVPLILASILLGKRTGAIAGAFGMGLFDLMAGWAAWAPGRLSPWASWAMSWASLPGSGTERAFG